MDRPALQVQIPELSNNVRSSMAVFPPLARMRAVLRAVDGCELARQENEIVWPAKQSDCKASMTNLQELREEDLELQGSVEKPSNLSSVSDPWRYNYDRLVEEYVRRNRCRWVKWLRAKEKRNRAALMFEEDVMSNLEPEVSNHPPKVPEKRLMLVEDMMRDLETEEDFKADSSSTESYTDSDSYYEPDIDMNPFIQKPWMRLEDPTIDPDNDTGKPIARPRMLLEGDTPSPSPSSSNPKFNSPTSPHSQRHCFDFLYSPPLLASSKDDFTIDTDVSSPLGREETAQEFFSCLRRPGDSNSQLSCTRRARTNWQFDVEE